MVNSVSGVLELTIFSNGYCNRQITLHYHFGHISFSKLFHWIRFVDIVIFSPIISQVNKFNVTMALRIAIHHSFE